MKDIYICHTVYHVYIAMLKAFEHEGDIGIVLVDTIPRGYDLTAQIKRAKLFDNVYYVNRKKVFRKEYKEFLKNFILCKRKGKHIDKGLSFIKDYESVYIFNDYSEMGCYLENEAIPYHLVEDGLDVYKQFDVYESIGRGYSIKKILYRMAKIPYSVGMNKSCIDVEINDDVGLKTIIKQPIRIVNRKDLEIRISPEHREKMNEAFGVGDIGVIDSGILILTQILPEIMVVSNEEEQYRYYENVVKKYTDKNKVFLKPHPRDTIDYSMLKEKYNVVILRKEVPMEVYASLPNIHFDCIVTYSSTAANITGVADKIVRLDKSI